jgi:hypothetical protein
MLGSLGYLPIVEKHLQDPNVDPVGGTGSTTLTNVSGE